MLSCPDVQGDRLVDTIWPSYLAIEAWQSFSNPSRNPLSTRFNLSILPKSLEGTDFSEFGRLQHCFLSHKKSCCLTKRQLCFFIVEERGWAARIEVDDRSCYCKIVWIAQLYSFGLRRRKAVNIPKTEVLSWAFLKRSCIPCSYSLPVFLVEVGSPQHTLLVPVWAHGDLAVSCQCMHLLQQKLHAKIRMLPTCWSSNKFPVLFCYLDIMSRLSDMDLLAGLHIFLFLVNISSCTAGCGLRTGAGCSRPGAPTVRWWSFERYDREIEPKNHFFKARFFPLEA